MTDMVLLCLLSYLSCCVMQFHKSIGTGTWHIKSHAGQCTFYYLELVLLGFMLL